MTAAGQGRLARAAAALRPYLLRYADYELETLARVVLDAAAEPAGQDGPLGDWQHPAWTAREELRRETVTDTRRAIADEVQDALGDTELLPAAVRAAFDDLLHRSGFDCSAYTTA